jgi:hypothetical protein
VRSGTYLVDSELSHAKGEGTDTTCHLLEFLSVPCCSRQCMNRMLSSSTGDG